MNVCDRFKAVERRIRRKTSGIVGQLVATQMAICDSPNLRLIQDYFLKLSKNVFLYALNGSKVTAYRELDRGLKTEFMGMLNGGIPWLK